MRTPLIAGNWKMHMKIADALDLVTGLHYGLRGAKAEVVVAPPFTALYPVAQKLENSFIDLAAQNMHYENKGAFTGEVSSDFLTDLGVHYVILGHSERREYFAETDEIINKKVLKALEAGLKPILCVGESLEQRERGDAFKVIGNQLGKNLNGFPLDAPLVIAYEPIWAIGTGKTASTQEIQDMHQFIRAFVGEFLGNSLAQETRILYGGSVKPDNAKEILGLSDVDGALVGGASLKVSDFSQIVNAAK